MAVVAQWNGVRVVGFQKCGHTSIINMFLTPVDDSIERGKAALIVNSQDQAAKVGAYRGDLAAAQTWPEPHTTIAFFREPIRRLLSAYQHFIVRTTRSPFIDMGFRSGMAFHEFCAHFITVDPTLDNHLKPQNLSFNEALVGRALIYKLEYLDAIWPQLVEHLGLKCTKEVARFNAAEYDIDTHLQGVHVDWVNIKYADDYNTWCEARETFSPVSSAASF